MLWQISNQDHGYGAESIADQMWNGFSIQFIDFLPEK